MQGWDVVNIYRDEGYSGTNVERPSFQLMMDEKGTWDVVVAAKMDRFHRNFRNLGDWADTLRGWGKDFAVLDIQIDTTTPVGMLIFRIMGAFAAMEAELIRSRTISGLKGKKNSGKHTGRPPMATRRSSLEHKAKKTVVCSNPVLKRFQPYFGFLN